MASIKSFPNNADEYIGAEEVMRWLHGRTSGVFAAQNNAAVTAVQNSMAVTVSDGTGWIRNADGDGVVWWNDTEKVSGLKLQLAIAAADSVLNRIDRIIVEWKTTNYVDKPEIKVLKGTAASSPAAPALTNNSTVRQLSLAQVKIAAGTIAITPATITDERLDETVCGLVTESLTVDTTTMQAQFTALLTAIQNELAQLEEGTAVELKKLQFTNTVVSVAAFVDDSTYADFPYRAAINLTGVMASMIPEVIFRIDDAAAGNYAPGAESYNGGIYIYAAEKPETAVTIPTILCWKGNSI